MPTISVSEEPLAWIRQHVHAEYGIYFPENKLYSLESKLKRRVRKLDLEGIGDYAGYLRDNPDEVPYFLEAITTNKTKFFRETKHWDFLENKIIPRWRKKNKLRIWSAACSSGEEPYTIAILLEEAKQKYSDFPGYQILASDISEEIIRVGARGIYPSQALNPVRQYDKNFVGKYFERDEQGNYRVLDHIREQIYFRQFNLKFKSNPFRRKFDLIITKNVLIYFDQQMIQNVVANSEQLLNPGGLFFISHTESLHEVDHKLNKIQPSIFQK